MSSPETPTAPVHELMYTAFLCCKHAAVAIGSGYSDSSKTFLSLRSRKSQDYVRVPHSVFFFYNKWLRIRFTTN